MATVVGFAFWGLSATSVGKQVFLLVITTIPNAMRRMATTAATVKKAAVSRSKSPPWAVKKQLLVVLHRRVHTVEVAYTAPPTRNKAITFCTGASRTFCTAKGGFLYLRLFSLPSGRRGWEWRGIAESALSR